MGKAKKEIEKLKDPTHRIHGFKSELQTAVRAVRASIGVFGSDACPDAFKKIEAAELLLAKSSTSELSEYESSLKNATEEVTDVWHQQIQTGK